MIGRTEQTTDALDWIFRHTGLIDLAVRQWVDGRGVWIAPDRPRGRHLAGLDRASVERLRGFLSARNLAGGDVFWRPVMPAPLMMLDDLPPKAAQLLSEQYGVLAVQTSGASAQAWIVADRPLAIEERHCLQARMIAEHGADPGAAGGRQLGRLPGFRNRKPVYSSAPPWVNLLAVTDGPPLSVAVVLTSDSPPPRGGGARDRQGAKVAPRDARAAARGENDDASARDWAIACQGIAAGEAREEIVRRIAGRALSRGKRETWTSCLAYAERTVARASSRS